ncbi:MAG: hypothetical protein Q4G07_03285 [Oscillospiraceae bacterium]|nr:hypothetical protein [Oscillospiraceae bacterium]
MAFTAPLTYKNRPLVRMGNQIYYGSMTDPCVAYLQVLTTKTVDGVEEADRVHVSLLATDQKLPPAQRLLQQGNKTGLYAALEIATIWLEHALADAKKQ